MKTRAVVIMTECFVQIVRVQSARGRWTQQSEAGADITVPAALTEGTDLSSLVGPMIEALESAGATGDSIDLVIPSGWCFFSQLTLAGRRFTETLAAYQLEEFLPVPLEEVTVAFLNHGPQAWGIAVRTRPLHDLIQQIEARGVHVEHIFVDVCAGLATLPNDDDGAIGLMIQGPQRASIGLQVTVGALPVSLRTVFLEGAHGCAEALDRQLALTAERAGVVDPLWHTCRIPAPVQGGTDELSDSASVQQPVDGRQQDLALREIALAAANDSTLPDLRIGALAATDRYDALYRRCARTMVLLALLMMVVGARGLFERRILQAEFAAVHAEQVTVFKSALPEVDAAAASAIRLASERRRLEGLTGGSVTEKATLNGRRRLPAAVLEDICRFVRELPGDVRVMLLEANIDDQQMTLRGRTADHRDAERIAEAASRLVDWQASPPRTSRLSSGGVEFSIRAKREHRESTD